MVNNGQEITYTSFLRDIGKVTRALREMGIPRGALAAIDCKNFYWSWLLRLACEELRLVTTTMSVPENLDASSHLRHFKLIFSEHPIRSPSAGQQHRIASEWVRGSLDREGADRLPPSAIEPSEALCILRTSGTTGTPKMVLQTHELHARRVETLMRFAALTRQSRFLVASPTNARTHAACFWAGATVVMESRMPLGKALDFHAITHSMLPPIMLTLALDDLDGSAGPRDLTIFSFGAALSRALRKRALGIATAVYDLYGSNEVGYVSSTRDDDDFGTVWPSARVEIVNDRDEPLPDGQVGRIRVRSDSMAGGYLDDPVTTARVFRDGWFYTGDVGRVRGLDRLQVIGRADDVLNIGWKKIAPAPLEELLLGTVDVDDVGVCSVQNPDGIEEIWVIAAAPRCSDEALEEGVIRAFDGIQLGRFHIARVDRVPRNANGKLQRDLLKEIALAETQRGQ